MVKTALFLKVIWYEFVLADSPFSPPTVKCFKLITELSILGSILFKSLIFVLSRWIEDFSWCSEKLNRKPIFLRKSSVFLIKQKHMIYNQYWASLLQQHKFPLFRHLSIFLSRSVCCWGFSPYANCHRENVPITNKPYHQEQILSRNLNP